MKAILLSSIATLLIVLPVLSVAQAWLPVGPGEKYNYQFGDMDIIHTTVWIDSMHIAPGDSIYYLNRVYKTDTAGYDLWNQPNFLQKELHVTEDYFTFVSPREYVIRRNMNIGDSWVFDPAHMTTAILIDTRADSILGQPDSVRVILLHRDQGTFQDTLVISKMHGILRFPDLLPDGHCYSLVGLESLGLGKRMPMKKDIYDFQEGDVFEYRIKSASHSNSSYGIDSTMLRYTVTGVIQGDSGISYSKVGFWKKQLHTYDLLNGHVFTESSGSIDEFVKIDFYNYSYENLYNNELFYLINHQAFKPVYYEMNGTFNRPQKIQDELFFGCSLDSDTLWVKSFTLFFKEAVCEGLGRVSYYEYRCYNEDVRKYEELTAYKKGDETFGTFSDWLNSGPNHSLENIVIRYAAPGSIIVANQSGHQMDYDLLLADVNGRILMDEKGNSIPGSSGKTHYIPEIPKGLYLVRITTDSGTYSKKIIR